MSTFDKLCIVKLTLENWRKEILLSRFEPTRNFLSFSLNESLLLTKYICLTKLS